MSGQFQFWAAAGAYLRMRSTYQVRAASASGLLTVIFPSLNQLAPNSRKIEEKM